MDVLILGGGINGAGIARDLALRSERTGIPLSVGLIEQNHFASGTSGKNSQLIHGGLRYLENLEFGLVREALRERARLLRLAQPLVKPLCFLMPIYGRWKSFYYLTGLTLYDLLAGRHNVGAHRRLRAREVSEREPGLSTAGLTSSALFYDCRMNAARLVLANVFDALGHGAVAANYVRAESWTRDGDFWRVRLTDTLSAEQFETRARKLVDTTGPWSRTGEVRLVRGSHLVLPRVNTGECAIAYFEEGGRIVFVIPWGTRNRFSLVGTTDVDHSGSPNDVHISRAEIDYLLGVVRRLFPSASALEPISAYSALRPLVRDTVHPAMRASREHRIWNSPDGVLHVAGGKYTTYRLMSQEAADLVASEVTPALATLHLTADTPIPAAEPPALPFEQLAAWAVETEMAQRLSDLLLVSTYLGYEQKWSCDALAPCAREMGRLLGWSPGRIDEEMERVLCLTAPPA